MYLLFCVKFFITEMHTVLQFLWPSWDACRYDADDDDDDDEEEEEEENSWASERKSK